MASLNVVIACGGTGGHLFPGVAVAEELRRRGHRVLLLVSEKEIDRRALAGRDLPSQTLPAIGWPGVNRRALAFAIRLWQTERSCRALFRDQRPDAVVGMGGFTSAVPLWLARRAGIPTLLHESNAIPGLVTRLMGRRVTRLLLGFGIAREHLPGAAAVVTGTPVRDNLIVLPRAEAAARFGLDPERPTLLVCGGSQGAQGVNRAIRETLPLWRDQREAWQFVHLTGQADEAEVAAAYAREGFRAVVRAFCDDMAALYSLADLVVSRSGASSLTELSHYGLASILIPFPAAAADHQTANARVFTSAGAAVLHRQDQLTPASLDAAVRGLLGDAGKLAAMKAAARRLAVPDAAARVADQIESCT